MGQYKSQYTGPQIDAGVDAALNPDVTVTPDSDALVTSGAVADALDNIDPTITSNTDTTLNGILVGNGSKVGTKSLDTSSLTNDADHVPVSSVVKSALDNKADASAVGNLGKIVYINTWANSDYVASVPFSDYRYLLPVMNYRGGAPIGMGSLIPTSLISGSEIWAPASVNDSVYGRFEINLVSAGNCSVKCVCTSSDTMSLYGIL